MVDYNLLSEMLEIALANETCESWNERLNGGFKDSQLIDVVSTLDVSFVYSQGLLSVTNSSWVHETTIEETAVKAISGNSAEYAMAA